jgi:hypothetical protein
MFSRSTPFTGAISVDLLDTRVHQRIPTKKMGSPMV